METGPPQKNVGVVWGVGTTHRRGANQHGGGEKEKEIRCGAHEEDIAPCWLLYARIG